MYGIYFTVKSNIYQSNFWLELRKKIKCAKKD